VIRPLALCAAALVLAFAAPAAAQSYPTQPIHLIVPFGPGGGSDIVGRIVGQALQEKLGQAVVVENRPGAGGTIGNEVIARSPVDGYTLGVMTAGQLIQAVMLKSLHYDTRTAFDPIAQVATAGLLMVTRPDFPASDVAELIALAKQKPGKVVFGSPGFGATQHLAAELFKQTAGVDMLHVPFRTSPEVTTALLAAQVDVASAVARPRDRVRAVPVVVEGEADHQRIIPERGLEHGNVVGDEGRLVATERVRHLRLHHGTLRRGKPRHRCWPLVDHGGEQTCCLRI